MRALLVTATLLAATLATAGCTDLEAGAGSRSSGGEGECRGEQGPSGQRAQCRFEGGECWGSQGPNGQSGGCRWG